MIKMIIVDDEYIILDSLNTLVDWASIGVEVVGTADNGAAAIDLTLKQRPDIILSDISMPYFSGLEMLETLRRHDLPTEVIFITAYGKFEYARDAIRYGVFDYILKPINEELLLQTVARCAGKIREERTRQRLLEQASGENRRQREALLTDCLLRGRAPAEAALRELFAADTPGGPPQDPGALVATLAGLWRRDSGDFDLPPVFPPSTPVFPLRAAPDHTLLLILTPEKPPRDWAPWVSLEKYWTALFPGGIVTVSESADWETCFKRAYAQVSLALIGVRIHREKTGESPENGSISAGRGPVFFEDLRPSVNTRIETGSGAGGTGANSAGAGYAPIERCIREGRTGAVPGLLYRYFLGFLAGDSLYDPDLVKLRCIELTERLIREEGSMLPPPPEDHIMGIKKSIAACDSFAEVFDRVSVILKGLCGETAEAGMGNKKRLVRQTIRYIRKHYGEAISLPHAAAQLAISPNYLSKLFSAEMGETFSHYLLEFRIRQAEKFLLQSNDKVYEIAGKVGYSDVVHFSKVFKHCTGLSPNRYRNQR
ncbi:MAG: response regulator [Spirochaetaceae bacterium]|jgi:two-component system response regulator YesN|nr:response regulator [Spirochaetaceae bacterium]